MSDLKLPTLCEWNVDGTWVVSRAQAHQLLTMLNAALRESAADKQRIAELESELVITKDSEVRLGALVDNSIRLVESLQQKVERAESELALARDLIERHKQKEPTDWKAVAEQLVRYVKGEHGGAFLVAETIKDHTTVPAPPESMRKEKQA